MSSSVRFTGVAAALGLALAPGAARGDEFSPTVVVYGANNNVTPKHRVWSGTAWGAAQNCTAITGYPHWIVARNCPTRNETACMILDENRDLHMLFYIGDEGGGSEQWTAPEVVCTNVGMSYIERACDMVYENSGDVLVAYWNATESRVGYRRCVEGVVGDEGLLDIGTTGDLRWMCLVQSPRKNKVVLLAVDTTEKLFGAVWSGSSFYPAELLCTDLATDQRQGFHAAFEGLSGDGMIAYCGESDGLLLYRTITGADIGPQQSGPVFGAVDHYWVRLAGSPTSDQIVAVSLNASNELHAAAWDGAAWGGVTAVATGLQYNDRRNYDVAWQANGALCLLVFAESGSGNRRYATWDGALWSGVGTAGSTSQNNTTFALFPADSGDAVYCLINDTGNDLESSRWSAGSLSTHAQLNGTIEGAQKAQPYSVAVPVTAGPQEPRVVRVSEWRETDPD